MRALDSRSGRHGGARRWARAAAAATSPEKDGHRNDRRRSYNDDLNAIQAHFDDALQKQITLDGVAALSKKLHAFGA